MNREESSSCGLLRLVALVALVVSCGTDKRPSLSGVSIEALGFCMNLPPELESWAKQYRELNEVSDPTKKAAAERLLLLDPSRGARAVVVHRLQGELRFCTAIRKLDPHEMAARQDQVYGALMKLLDGDDSVTVQKSLDGLWPIVKLINQLPLADD